MDIYGFGDVHVHVHYDNIDKGKYIYLFHSLLKQVTKCLVTRADTARDAKPISARSREPKMALT